MNVTDLVSASTVATDGFDLAAPTQLASFVVAEVAIEMSPPGSSRAKSAGVRSALVGGRVER